MVLACYLPLTDILNVELVDPYPLHRQQEGVVAGHQRGVLHGACIRPGGAESEIRVLMMGMIWSV